MPATNATSEKAFSTMRRLTTYLRSRCGQARLNHLMLPRIYRDSLDRLELSEVARAFLKRNEHRLRVFW